LSTYDKILLPRYLLEIFALPIGFCAKPPAGQFFLICGDMTADGTPTPYLPLVIYAPSSEVITAIPLE